MADEPERMQELRRRLDAVRRDTEASPVEPAAVGDDSPVRPGQARGTVRGVLNVVGLVLAVVVVFQFAFTLTAFNGHDFDDARRVGRATVESCQRRGPVGLRFGYWDDCVVAIKWNDGVAQRGKLGKPHLFHADEVGRTVAIGDNGTGRNGRTYSRPTFGPQPVLAALGIVLFVVAAVPGLLLLWLFWHLAGSAFRRR